MKTEKEIIKRKAILKSEKNKIIEKLKYDVLVGRQRQMLIIRLRQVEFLISELNWVIEIKQEY